MRLRDPALAHSLASESYSTVALVKKFLRFEDAPWQRLCRFACHMAELLSKKGGSREHFRAMLARYSDRASFVEPMFLTTSHRCSRVYDPALQQATAAKAGSDVAHFEHRMDRDHPGHKSGFFVDWIDGSNINFSTR